MSTLGYRKQYCPKGHDTFLIGRNTHHGRCKKCVSIDQKERYTRLGPVAGWKYAGILNFTLVDYDRLYQIQQGCCAICRIHQTKLNRRLDVDHNHLTGKVRGLLCMKCNTAVGQYEKLKDAIQGYLNVH